MSPKSAGLAGKMGFENVRVMLQGNPGWEQSGRHLVASDGFVAKGNAVILDLRPAKAVVAGHIPRAVNLPLADLAEAQEKFPKKPSMPIILYGEGDAAQQARGIIKEWGYKKVALVDGGLSGWQARGGSLQQGPAASEIRWVRTPVEGEVSLAEFRQAVETNPPGVLILDIRSVDEAAACKVKNSVNIPLEQLENRLAEIPRDKEMLVHCTTGARAEMAYQMLKKAGYKARYLIADSECKGEDCVFNE